MEEIVRILKVDTKNSGKSIKELKNEIKGLRSELDKAVVGSEEFESTMRKLTQTQKTYNNIQQQIRDMSRTNQQDMVRLAGFAKNLAKSYSAVNAAINLFADGNEDVNKAMLKVQRTIQLIQGLDGIAGLVRDLPKLVNAFKGWLSFLDPIERKITSIVKGINGANPAKLRAMNEANRAGATSSSSASATVYGDRQVNAQNQALQEQTRVITALNAAREELQGKILAAKQQIDSEREALDKQNKALSTAKTELDKYTKQMDGLQTAYHQQKTSASELSATVSELAKANKEAGNTAKTVFDPATKAWTKARTQLREIQNEISATEANIESTKTAIQGAKGNIETLNASIAKNEAALAKDEAQYAKLTAQINGTSSAVSKLGTVLKTIGKTVGWTVVISFAVGVVLKLLDSLGLTVEKFWDWVTGAESAAGATKKFNKEISEMTNQNAAKALVSLQELSRAFAKVGDSAEAKKKFLDDYKSKIQETGLAIDTVEEAEDVFVKNTSKYVEAIKKRAQAQAIEAELVKLYTDYMNERYDLEQKLEKAQANNRERRQARLKQRIQELDEDYDKRSSKWLDMITELETEYSKVYAVLESTTSGGSGKDKTDWAEEYKKALDSLKKYNQDRLDEMKDARTRELDENKRAYEEDLKNIQENYKAGVKAAQGNKEKLLAVEEEKNKALKLAQIRYERTRLEIIDRYNDEVYEKQKSELDREYSLLEKQLERNRRLYDTTNLREPKQVNYQTTYNQNPLPLGLGRNWLSVYQSKDDVERQYKDQVEYNNKYLEVTRRRIDGENKLLDEENKNLIEKAKVLKQQLDSTDLNDVDKRKEIVDQLIDVNNTLETNETTIAENRMALDDAVLENEQANLDAYLEMQDKKRQALDGILDVTSNLSGALADMFKMEAQNSAEGSKRQKAALKAYKAMAITQAVADTWKGANEAYAAMASIPYVGPALGIAAAATAVAMGLANVKRIISESTSSSTTQQASVSAPAPVDTAPISYSRNLIGDKELDNINQPIKCYVLESDITNTQNKVKVTESNATF